MTIQAQSDIRSPIQFATSFRHRHHHHHHHGLKLSRSIIFRQSPPKSRSLFIRVKAFSTDTEENSITGVGKLPDKPSICTADELHYVTVKNSQWRLALWRYSPPPQAPRRNHPLLLLSGLGTNAIGYDLSPGSSFARYMCGQGFDTWILEVRGAGLSMQESDAKDIEKSAHAISEEMEAAAEDATNGVISTVRKLTDNQNSSAESKVAVVNEDAMGIATAWDESKLVAKLTETFMSLSERFSGFLNESQSRIMSAKLFDQISKLLEDSFLYERFNEVKGKLLSLLETRQNSAVAGQIRDLSQKLVNIVEEGQRSVSPQLNDLQERLATTLEDFQKQLDLIVKYDWDFDHYLEEDVPSAMEYIRAQTGPRDGKLFAIGHSMGGILLYAMLSRCGFEGRESGLAAVVTLASSLDYTSSKSSLKLLLPLADPAQILNVPVVPLGALLSSAYPLSSSPPYVLSWLVDLISAEDMMHPELLKKLVLNNFCTIPVKLLLQLATAFREGGLRDRSGKFFYEDHLHKCDVPVLAIAGDCDLICPPEAVYETVKLLPENLVTYKVFGEQDGPHYAHYDLVGGRMVKEGDNIIDLGLSLRALQPEAYHPSPHDDFDVLIDWQQLHPQLKNSKTEYPQNIAGNYDDEVEGIQSKERWAYVKVNMDGVIVGRKICILDHMGYSTLALQLEEMFGKQSVCGLRLFQSVSEFSLLYKDRDDHWRIVGDVPWKDFVERVKRLRIVRKDEAFIPSSSALLNSL